MENKEKQITEETKNPARQVQNIEAAGESLSETELDQIAGGKTSINGSRSNIKTNVS